MSTRVTRHDVREFVVGILEVLGIAAVMTVATVFLLFCATVGTLDENLAPIPCPTEDSPGPCYWNAETMGNGEGRSFTVDILGNVTYWTDGNIGPDEADTSADWDEEN